MAEERIGILFESKVDAGFKEILDILKSLSGTIGKIITSGDELSKSSKKAGDAIGGLGKKVKDTGEHVDRARSHFDALNKFFGKDGLVGLLKWQVAWYAAQQPIFLMINAIKDSIGQFIAFEQAIKDLSAITNTYGTALDELANKARSLATVYAFSQVEIAQGMKILGQAGLSASEILKTISAAMILATATGSNLAESVKLITTTLRAFDLDASQSLRITNVFGAAINQTKLSMEDLNTIFNYVAAQGGLLNESITEVAAAAGLLANQGQRASTIGTGLSSMLGRLLSPTPKLIKALAEIGVNVNDLNPRFHTLAEIIETLEKHGANVETVFKGFDQRIARTAASLINAGSPALREMTAELDNTRDAERMAETQMEGLSNSFKKLYNQIKETVILVGNIFTPIIKVIIFLITSLSFKVIALGGAIVGLIIYFNTLAKTLGLVQILFIALNSWWLSWPILIFAAATAIAYLVSWLTKANDREKENIKTKEDSAKADKAKIDKLKELQKAITDQNYSNEKLQSMMSDMVSEYPFLIDFINQENLARKQLKNTIDEQIKSLDEKNKKDTLNVMNLKQAMALRLRSEAAGLEAGLKASIALETARYGGESNIPKGTLEYFDKQRIKIADLYKDAFKLEAQVRGFGESKTETREKALKEELAKQKKITEEIEEQNQYYDASIGLQEIDINKLEKKMKDEAELGMFRISNQQKILAIAKDVETSSIAKAQQEANADKDKLIKEDKLTKQEEDKIKSDTILKIAKANEVYQNEVDKMNDLAEKAKKVREKLTEDEIKEREKLWKKEEKQHLEALKLSEKMAKVTLDQKNLEASIEEEIIKNKKNSSEMIQKAQEKLLAILEERKTLELEILNYQTKQEIAEVPIEDWKKLLGILSIYDVKKQTILMESGKAITGVIDTATETIKARQAKAESTLGLTLPAEFKRRADEIRKQAKIEAEEFGKTAEDKILIYAAMNMRLQELDNQRYDQWYKSQDKMTQFAIDTSEKILTQSGNFLADFLSSVGSGTKSLKTALVDMMRDFTKATMRAIVQLMIIEPLIAKIKKDMEDARAGGGGFFGWLSGLFGGGSPGVTPGLAEKGGEVGPNLGTVVEAAPVAAGGAGAGRPGSPIASKRVFNATVQTQQPTLIPSVQRKEENVTYNIFANDPSSFASMMYQNKAVIHRVVSDNINKNSSLRRTVGR